MGIRTENNRRYGGVDLGVLIRGQVGHDVIFRVRPGTGYLEGDEKDVYQDQYAYFVPTSITNIEGQPARDALTAAVSAWQALSPSQKAIWNYKAIRQGLSMSGYNLFVKEWIEEAI